MLATRGKNDKGVPLVKPCTHVHDPHPEQHNADSHGDDADEEKKGGGKGKK